MGLLDKYFVARAVYDPEEDEVLEGATVTLRSSDGTREATILTDLIGDFWFERQDPRQYSLVIEKTGYVSKSIGPIDASADTNVGDIELHQATQACSSSSGSAT